jgi:hypothetical protein
MAYSAQRKEAAMCQCSAEFVCSKTNTTNINSEFLQFREHDSQQRLLHLSLEATEHLMISTVQN